MIAIINRINNNKLYYFENFFLLSIIIGPFFLPFSRFFSDFFISLSGLLFLFITIIKNDYKIFLRKYAIILYCWYLYLLFISFISYDTLLSLQSTLFYFRFIIFSFAIIYCLKNYMNFSKLFLISLSLSTIILLIDSYIQLLFGYNIIGYKYDNNWNRLSSFFKEDYILGSYLSRIIPLVLGLLFLSKVKNKLNYIIISLFLILTFIIILFSGDRSGLLYFIIFLVFFIFLLNLKISYKLLFFLTFFSLFLLIIFNNNSIYKRMVEYTQSQIFNNSSLYFFSVQHQLIYNTSFKIIKDNYIFGIGPKNFRVICKDYQSFDKLDVTEDGCSTHPHNTYIQLLVETGIIGFLFIFIIFLLIIYYLFYKIYLTNILKNYNHFLGRDLILLSLFISLWPIIPTGSFFNNWLNIIYYLPLGFIIYYYFEYKNEH